MMARDYNFWTYIVTNKNHSVLYIGVTNSLSRRTWELKKWSRAKKVVLINRLNPSWHDLGADVLQDR